jgi:hypothetical protein
MDELVRHRQLKGSATDRLISKPPRHISTLPHKGDREASLPERDNGPVPWSGQQTDFLERTYEKKASAEPSTKEGIAAVYLCASLLHAPSRLSIDMSSFSL